MITDELIEILKKYPGALVRIEWETTVHDIMPENIDFGAPTYAPAEPYVLIDANDNRWNG